MPVRLGHVLGWIGNILGGLFVVIGLANYFQVYEWTISKLSGSSVVYDPVLIAQLNFLEEHNLKSAEGLGGVLLKGFSEAAAAARKAQLETLITLLIFGVVIFLIGQALRYILAGSK